MLRKTLALMLSGLVILAAVGFNAVRAQTAQDSATIEKVRTKVTKLGVGREARVEVRLRDNTKLKGYISAANQDSFTVSDAKTGVARSVDYGEVTEVKKSGGGLSTTTWIILAGVATAAVIVAVTVVKPVLCDGGAGC